MLQVHKKTSHLFSDNISRKCINLNKNFSQCSRESADFVCLKLTCIALCVKHSLLTAI